MKGKGKGTEGIKRASGGYVFCDVPLCKAGHCWARFHSIKALFPSIKSHFIVPLYRPIRQPLS
jgi:hypothetical protein